MKTRITTLQICTSALVAVWFTVASTTSFAAGPPMDILNEKNPNVQVVMSIQERFTPALMSIPGVVGTATGLDAAGRLAVKVFVEFPEVAGLPRVLQGVPVDVEVTGMFEARLQTTDTWPRPVPIGVSTGHPSITAGTLGCRVIDIDGKRYALSNNHVYANSNNASVEDPVLQPGPYDGGTLNDTIGFLADFEPIRFDGTVNTIDAAIAEVSTSTVGTSTPDGLGYGTPSTTTVPASLGMEVQKVGRTTTWTFGTVTALNATVTVCYEARGPFRCVKLAKFEDQILIEPGTFSAGGDSGSLIVTLAGNNPVGLLFAGSSTHTIANPIDAVLSRFSVSIDVTDDGNGNDPVNTPPTASFTYEASGLAVSFTDTSTDTDGSVVSWSWNFGDGSDNSTAQNPTHTYTTGGTYTVTLTVTDNQNTTDSVTESVTVTAPVDPGSIALTATGYKVKGRQHADLTWTGATSTNIEVYRNGVWIATTTNDGSYTDNINQVGGGTYTYRICEAGTATCSNDATVTF